MTKINKYIKAKQLASNLSSCDTSVVEACNLLKDGYESTIEVSKQIYHHEKVNGFT